MQLTLGHREAELLQNVLERSIGDLRMEIVKTENFQMRNELKEDEVLLKGILERCRPAHAR